MIIIYSKDDIRGRHVHISIKILHTLILSQRENQLYYDWVNLKYFHNPFNTICGYERRMAAWTWKVLLDVENWRKKKLSELNCCWEFLFCRQFFPSCKIYARHHSLCFIIEERSPTRRSSLLSKGGGKPCILYINPYSLFDSIIRSNIDIIT